MLIAVIGSVVCYYVFMKVTGYRGASQLCHPYLPIFIGMLTILLFLLISIPIRI